MKLTKLTISEFRSISEAHIPIDREITTLVGANEHGKTNVLAAMQLLDFITPIKYGDRRAMKDPIGKKTKETKIVYDIAFTNDDTRKILELLPKEEPAEPVATPATEKAKEGEVPAPAVQKVRIKKTALSDIPTAVKLQITFHDSETNLYTVLGVAENLVETILSYLKSQMNDKVFYFDTFTDKLEHRIPKDEIINKTNEVTNGLIKLSGLSGHEAALFEDSAAARQLRIKGAEELTKQLKDLWVQGKEDEIKVQFTLSNDFLCVDIEDLNTYGDISTRSRGFLFFVSFILKYKQYHDGDLSNHIFLIDEPGIFLHPRGQKDLLQYLEKLGKSNQVVYTTHSPFMINRLNTEKVMVVSKSTSRGTQINSKPYTHNWKALRASLGMMLADSFYYADANLLVEGASERLYIITLLKYFNDQQLLISDLNILSIIDAGGASNVAAMGKIIASEERPFVVLVDADAAGARAKTDVLKFMEPNKVTDVNAFDPAAVTTEDLLPTSIFQKAVNNAITELVTDKILPKTPTAAFTIKTEHSNVINQLTAYLQEEFEVEEISKLHIARHFDLEMSTGKLTDADNKRLEPMIKWVIKELKIGA